MVAVRGTMLTERCYQRMTRRSNPDETPMRAPPYGGAARTAPLNCGAVRAALPPWSTGG